MDQPRRIIIVGGGVRGLACAIHLGQKSDLNIIIIVNFVITQLLLS